MIEFIIGAFLFAKFKKGYKLKYIFKKFPIYLPLIASLFYIYLEYCVFNQQYWFFPYQYIIKTTTLLSYIPLIYVYNLHRCDEIHNNAFIDFIKSPASKASFCLWFGSVLNRLALNANNGYMAVFPSNCYWTGYIKPDFVSDGVHILGNAYTKLIPLCDWIDVGIYCASPGDILARLFVFIIIYYSIKNSNKNSNKMIK